MTGLFGVHVFLPQLGVHHGIGQHGQRGGRVGGADRAIKMRPVIRSRRIQRAAQVFNRRVNLARLARRRSLEDQMLHEMRDAVVFRRFPPRPGPDPDIHRHQIGGIGGRDQHLQAVGQRVFRDRSQPDGRRRRSRCQSRRDNRRRGGGIRLGETKQRKAEQRNNQGRGDQAGDAQRLGFLPTEDTVIVPEKSPQLFPARTCAPMEELFGH